LGTEPLQALSAGRGFDPHNGLVFLLSFNGFLANVEVAVYPCLFANLFGRDLTVNSRSKRAVLVSKNGIYSDDCMIIALMAQVPLALAFGFSVLAQAVGGVHPPNFGQPRVGRVSRNSPGPGNSADNIGM
jgi:hypothetical protein